MEIPEDKAEKDKLCRKIRKEALPEVFAHEEAMRKAGKVFRREIKSDTIPAPREQESYIYEITNLTDNRYRFQFNRLKVIFEPHETKVIDISKEPSWKLGLKVLPNQKDAKTESNIFKIEKVKRNEL